jgi:hypothetical protein
MQFPEGRHSSRRDATDGHRGPGSPGQPLATGSMWTFLFDWKRTVPSTSA